jgi:hypothetical protein
VSQDSDDHANDQPNTKTISGKCKDITKGQVILWEAIIGAWVIGTSIIGGGLLSYHLTAAGISLCFCAISSLFYGIFLHYKHKFRGSKRPSQIALLLFFSINCLMVGFAPVSFTDYFSTQLERFHVTLLDSLVSGNPLEKAKFTQFVVYAPQAPTSGPHPIQFMAFFMVENEQPLNATVTGFQLEGARYARGPWTQLCPVSVVGRGLYLASDLKKAVPLSTDNFLDYTLFGKTMQPEAPISGWGAWECNGKCPISFLRVTLQEASGKSSSQILNLNSRSSKYAGIGGTLSSLPGFMDLTRGSVSIAPECLR